MISPESSDEDDIGREADLNDEIVPSDQWVKREELSGATTR